MIIAYIMRYWPVYGGGETITAILAKELVKRGHVVHILYKYRNDVDPKPYDVDKNIIEKQIDTVCYTECNVINMASYLNEHGVNIMINQWGDHRLCYEAKLRSSSKLIICWHLDVIQKQFPTTLNQRILKILIGERFFQKWRTKKQLDIHLANMMMSDKYVFLSKAFENDYIRRVGDKVVKNKLESISNPLPYAINYDFSKYNKKEKVVLFVGRIYEYHKRISYVLKIWKILESNESLKEWSLKIVGDGPDMLLSQKLCKELNLQRVSFEGFKDPRPYYEQASLFMMTSRFEGFGMTLVEAQQYGVVPVVMDTYLSLHDIITTGENGEIVKDNDFEGYVAVMEELMTNVEERKQLALQGLKSCTKFKVCSIVDKWEELFVEILR